MFAVRTSTCRYRVAVHWTRGPYDAPLSAAVDGVDGHSECRRGQLLRQAAAHSPGNDPTRIEIEHHCQIQPPLGRPDIRDVAGPHSVEVCHDTLPIKRVWHGWMRMR
jgi:hypothetical protein